MASRAVRPDAAPRLAADSLDDLPAISSTQVQNRFGGVLDELRKNGTIVIERHDRPAAVLLSIDEFARLRANSSPDRDLNLLTANFDALVARMQGAAAAGLSRAFAASPAELAAASAPVIRKSVASVRKKR